MWDNVNRTEETCSVQKQFILIMEIKKVHYMYQDVWRVWNIHKPSEQSSFQRWKLKKCQDTISQSLLLGHFGTLSWTRGVSHKCHLNFIKQSDSSCTRKEGKKYMCSRSSVSQVCRPITCPMALNSDWVSGFSISPGTGDWNSMSRSLFTFTLSSLRNLLISASSCTWSVNKSNAQITLRTDCKTSVW